MDGLQAPEECLHVVPGGAHSALMRAVRVCVPGQLANAQRTLPRQGVIVTKACNRCIFEQIHPGSEQ